jgi:hypothetical protein
MGFRVKVGLVLHSFDRFRHVVSSTITTVVTDMHAAVMTPALNTAWTGGSHAYELFELVDTTVVRLLDASGMRCMRDLMTSIQVAMACQATASSIDCANMWVSLAWCID